GVPADGGTDTGQQVCHGHRESFGGGKGGGAGVHRVAGDSPAARISTRTADRLAAWPGPSSAQRPAVVAHSSASPTGSPVGSPPTRPPRRVAAPTSRTAGRWRPAGTG